MKHHNGNPYPHEVVNRVRGLKWAVELDKKRTEAIGIRYGRSWYEQKAIELEEVLSKIEQ
jgi:hypothetical protein